jgi:hypothetical protein
LRLVYELPVTDRVRFKVAPDPGPLDIGDTKSEVAWSIEGADLSGVTLVFPEQSVCTTDPIKPCPGFEETAFRFAAYVANSILKQTGRDVIDARAVLLRSPRLEAETDEETKLLATRRLTVFLGATMDAVGTKPFDPFEIGHDVAHPPALALYADGLRATDPFVRFEMFYRVMEYFFPNPQNNAPRYLRNCLDFSGKQERDIREQVQSWHELRRRSVHPRPRGDLALHRDDLRALHEVRKHEPGMERVARWLLDNPPPKAPSHRRRGQSRRQR